jgi:hypothetical protein
LGYTEPGVDEDPLTLEVVQGVLLAS